MVAQQRVRIVRESGHGEASGRHSRGTRGGWLAIACLLGGLISACGSDAGKATSDPPRAQIDPGMAVSVYECSDGYRFTVAVDTDSALLLLHTGPVSLPAARSASGARYQNEDAEFWSKGEEALLRINGIERRGCVSDRPAAIREGARLRGVDYRAMGNEPGWHLEITNSGISRYVGDYGATVVEYPTPPPGDGHGDGAITYVWADDGFRIAISLRPEPCQDTMADVDYPWTASVDVNGRKLNGCAWALSQRTR
jgi:uncharacterized membrane protein